MDSLKLDKLAEPLRREIINGKVYLVAGASTDHAITVKNLTWIFEGYLRGKKCRLFGENVKVNFDEESPEVLPDIKIVCDPNKIKKNEIKGAPDFIAEVLSPRTKIKDMTEKKDLYEKHGVKEYWIINTNDKSVDVYILKDGKLVRDYIYIEFDEDDIKDIEATGTKEEKEMLKITTIKTSVFGDDLIIKISDIFENID